MYTAHTGADLEHLAWVTGRLHHWALQDTYYTRPLYQVWEVE